MATNPITPAESDDSAGLSRRAVTRAMAWAVPTIAVSTTAPAFAASPGIFEFTGAGCRLPANSDDTFLGYALGITATNPFDAEITLTINSLTLNGEDLGGVVIVQTDPSSAGVCASDGLNTLVIPANTTLTNLVVLTVNAASSASGELAVNYTVTGGPGGTYDVTGSTNAGSPINGASCTAFTSAQKSCLSTFVTATV